MEDRYDAVDIVVKRSEGLIVTFADEHVAEFDLMRLRLACPCATCRSLREHGEEAWPGHGSPARLQITTAELHGAWGLNITWNDGHNTGIYPFEQLRRWSE
jgi:ATP-binding protein involved in chromosome partitioning